MKQEYRQEKTPMPTTSTKTVNTGRRTESILQSPIFVNGPRMVGHTLTHCDALCILIIDGQGIKLSRIEYALTLLLLGSPHLVRFETLVQTAYERGVSAHLIRLLRRRMSRIRLKLSPFGILVVSVPGEGYTYTQALPE